MLVDAMELFFLPELKSLFNNPIIKNLFEQI